MRSRLFTVILASLLVGALLAPAAASAQTRTTNPLRDIPISQEFTGADGATYLFEGLLTVTRFVNDGGRIGAVGTVTGTVTNAAGETVQNVNQTVRIPVTINRSTCRILLLELGPIDLDLLGLQVSVSPITVDITAQSGPGQLLGNLLCAIAGLLDPGGPLTRILDQVVNLLNRILGLLG